MAPLNLVSPTPSDINIAQAVEPRPIVEIASALGLSQQQYDQYGMYKAKVKLSVKDDLAAVADGKYGALGKNCS
jgi:formate--tetrahydrofolate ligase